MNRSTLTHIFSSPPQIETARLLLRKMKPTDATDMYEYACRESVTRYLLWDPHPDPDYTRRYLNMVSRLYRSGDYYDWAVTLKQTGKMIGTCGFTSFDLPNKRAEIGYVISPDYHGCGIATEAVMAVLEYGFISLHLHRIEAHYIFGNDPSRRVMEKCGMAFEGICRGAMLIKGVHRDIGVCAILAPDFKAVFGSQGGRFGRVTKPPFSFF